MSKKLSINKDSVIERTLQKCSNSNTFKELIDNKFFDENDILPSQEQIGAAIRNLDLRSIKTRVAGNESSLVLYLGPQGDSVILL